MIVISNTFLCLNITERRRPLGRGRLFCFIKVIAFHGQQMQRAQQERQLREELLDRLRERGINLDDL
jgi:hypothetical protein